MVLVPRVRETEWLHRADPTVGLAGGADERAEIHQGLIKVVRFPLRDELTHEDVKHFAGMMTGMVLKRVAPRRGPERLLDLGLRAGPYGDQFGLKPSGLNLDKVMAAPAGIDLGPLEPRVPEVLRTPSGKIEL